MLDLGTTVQQDLGDGWGERSRTVRLIDYDTIENNDFTVVRQYSVEHYTECIPTSSSLSMVSPSASSSARAPT
jgi:type I site-specific restriction-modification system R (restriction) subunit